MTESRAMTDPIKLSGIHQSIKSSSVESGQCYAQVFGKSFVDVRKIDHRDSMFFYEITKDGDTYLSSIPFRKIGSSTMYLFSDNSIYEFNAVLGCQWYDEPPDKSMRWYLPGTETLLLEEKRRKLI